MLDALGIYLGNTAAVFTAIEESHVAWSHTKGMNALSGTKLYTLYEPYILFSNSPGRSTAGSSDGSGLGSAPSISWGRTILSE
jgi:hypothetical protein